MAVSAGLAAATRGATLANNNNNNMLPRGTTNGPPPTSYNPSCPPNPTDESSASRERERRLARCAQLRDSFLERRKKEINSSSTNIFSPWIVQFILEYKESEAKNVGQFGHIMKVLSDDSALRYGTQGPVTVLTIGDTHHYIQSIVTGQATQTIQNAMLQLGSPGLVDRVVVLTQYRVCFKEASEMEKCEFYLVIDGLCVVQLKAPVMAAQDCNREPSVLQKIKELWLKRLALQPSHSSEPASVSGVLMEMEENRLNILKENVKDCLSIFSTNTELDSEQLDVYPCTKWQAELKKDKIQQNIFTVPAKFLVIGPENYKKNGIFSPEEVASVPNNNGSSEDDVCSTASFFSAADTNNSVNALVKPWNTFPGMTLTTSQDNSGTPPVLPHVQQALLANTPKEKAPCSSSCTPDFFDPCAPMSHCNSEHTGPVATGSSTMIPPHCAASLKEPISQKSGHLQMDIANNSMSESDERIPCGQPSLQSAVLTHVPAHSSSVPLDEIAEENCAANLQKGQEIVTSSGEDVLETNRKTLLKRKHMMADNDNPSEMFCNSPFTKQDALEHSTAIISPPCNNLDRPRAQKPPLTFLSMPKRSRVEELHVQRDQASVNLRQSGRLLEKRNQGAAEGRTRSLERPLGFQQQECVRGPSFYATYKASTPELCTQVRSTRISRALLEWAYWVFNDM